MKRKLFSAILFGALLATSTSGLTSCKDYDDDITNLQGQIDKLATKEELSAKANELATSISAAQTAASAAADVAKAAQTAANNASTDAKAAADAAKAAADAAKAAKDKADEVDGKLTTAVSNAAQQIQDAVKDLATKQEVADSVKVVADKYDAQAKELKALSDRLAKVEAKLGMGEGGEDIDLTEIQAELDAIDEAFDAIIGDYSTMVTAITVVKNTQANLDNQLDFGWYTEQANEFGKNIATETLKFTRDAVKRSSDYLVVRVSPVNADLSSAANNISLINSKGQELRGKIDVTGVERYDGMLVSSTRAASDQTGLWKITYKAADGVSEDAFKGIAKSGANYILYAVSVKNVEGADTLNQAVLDSRRVISDYEVTLNAKKIVAYDMNPVPVDASGAALVTPNDVYTNTVNVTVKTATTNEKIKELKNRGNVLAQVNTLYEKIWKSAAVVGTSAFKGETKTGPGNGNADCLVSSAVTKYDDRSGKTNVVAKLGEEIKISFDKPIAGFYVTLDGRNALPVSGTEPEPSELNAWNSYTYEGVAKVKKEETILDANEPKATMFKGQEGIIKINSLYGQATGDEIGFRIFAVNLDGTLCDPDGVAFYVAVGEQAGSDIPFEAGNINIDKQAGNTSGEIAIAQNAFNGFTSTTPSCVNVADGNDKPSAYTVEYLTGSSWGGFAANATKLRVKINDATKFKDGGTYKITVPLQKRVSGTDYTVKNAVITFTKVMPTSCPTFIWKTNQTELQALVPAGNSYVVTGTPKNGILNFNNMFIVANGTQIEADQNYVFTLAGSEYDPSDNTKTGNLIRQYGTGEQYFKEIKSANKIAGASALLKYAALINNKFIDCTTPHALTTEYNYGDISSDNSKNPYKLSSSNYSLTYTTWSTQSADYMSYAWNTANLGSNSAPNYQPKNFMNTNTAAEAVPSILTANVKTSQGQMINGALRQPNLGEYLKSANKYLEITKVETKSNTNFSITDEYYEYDSSASNDTKIVFKAKNTGISVPNHSAQVWITVKDCFHKESIIKLDVEFKSVAANNKQLASNNL